MNQQQQYSSEEISSWLVHEVARQTKSEPIAISASQPFEALGLDSMKIVTLVGALEKWIDIELDATLMWEYPSIEQVSKCLAEMKSVH